MNVGGRVGVGDGVFNPSKKDADRRAQRSQGGSIFIDTPRPVWGKINKDESETSEMDASDAGCKTNFM